MRARLVSGILPPADQKEAEAILRACVHCGFCNATCPSYQVLGDERDGPRGRIYLMKNLLEGGEIGTTTLAPLDRCLGCRACETACPSGVHYTRLLELVRPAVDARVARSSIARLTRWGLLKIVPHRARFGALLALGRAFRPWLPAVLKRKIPPAPTRQYAVPIPATPFARFALLTGCAQASAAPQINQAARAVFGHCGMVLKESPAAGCCGALALHLGATDEAQACARRNIDAWYPLLAEREIAGIVSTSSGCTQILKDYAHLLRDDPHYAPRAAEVAGAVRDATEALPADRLKDALRAQAKPSDVEIACHAPCSLQHGLRAHPKLETLLRNAGFRLQPVTDSHLCCGSAGTYSLLQPRVANELLVRKLSALERGAPQAIATANIGCQLHLQTGTNVPVKHWLELLGDLLTHQ